MVAFVLRPLYLGKARCFSGDFSMNDVSFLQLPALSEQPEVIAGRRAFGKLRKGHWVDFLGSERVDEHGGESDFLDPHADVFGAFIQGELSIGARLLEGRKIDGPLPIQEFLNFSLPDDAVEVSRLVGRRVGERIRAMTMISFLTWVATQAASRAPYVCMSINTAAFASVMGRAQQVGYPDLFESLSGRKKTIVATDGTVVVHRPMRLRVEALDQGWVQQLLGDLVSTGSC